MPVEHGLLLENLLDLAHAPFTHTSTFAKGWPIPDVVRFNAARMLGGNWEPYPIDMSFEPPCMVLSTIGAPIPLPPSSLNPNLITFPTHPLSKRGCWARLQQTKLSPRFTPAHDEYQGLIRAEHEGEGQHSLPLIRGATSIKPGTLIFAAKDATPLHGKQFGV